MTPPKQQPPLSNYEREKQKTELQRAQDISYTVNHAIVCTVADTLANTPLNVMIQNAIGRGIGCGHAHAGHIAAAEVASDVIAIPFTIGVQRLFPGLMDGLSNVLEPVFGDLFKIGAKSGGKGWARKNGLDPNGPEAKEKTREIYEHEASHLGQAVVWTASAYGLNPVLQRTFELATGRRGNALSSWKAMYLSKGIASTLTSASLVGLRGFFPNAAEGWDTWTSKNIFIPVSRKTSGLLGISQETLTTLEQQEEQEKQYWKAKIAHAKQHRSAEDVSVPENTVTQVVESSTLQSISQPAAKL